jgi:putative phosphoesterase
MFKIIQNMPGVDGIIHLGDIYADVTALRDEFPELPVYFVLGNNDPSLHYPSSKMIEIGELKKVKIFITHGHEYFFETDFQKMVDNARDSGAAAVLFGHTHISEIDWGGGILVANPGSISCPRGGGASYGILEIEDGKIGYDNIKIS